jgi:hypothetical protein
MAYMNQKLVSFASFSTREAASNAILQVNGIKVVTSKLLIRLH